MTPIAGNPSTIKFRRANTLNSISPAFVSDLKTMVLEALEAEEPAGGLRDDEQLFGPGSRLELDWLDAVQLTNMVQHRFDLDLPEGPEGLKVMASIADLAAYLVRTGKA